MAKLLENTSISDHLQQLIDQANETLVLISPYLKINDQLRNSLEDRNRMKIDIRIVYSKNELQPEHISRMRELSFIRTSHCDNLHAKCYLNESEAIITSMNLHEYSQVTNEEMGIYVTKKDDPQLYDDIYQSAQRLLRISTEDEALVDNGEKGYCLRCGIAIEFNLQSPYCDVHYKSWTRFKNRNFQEKFCHLCGKEYPASVARPLCLDCYEK